MNSGIESFLHILRHDQRGQILPWMALGMAGFIGVTGLAIDAGHAYVVQTSLQSSCNAAAHAGAQLLDNSTSTLAEVKAQAQLIGDANDNQIISDTSLLQPPVLTPVLKCLKNIVVPCTNVDTDPNAIQVTATAKVSTYLMRVLGINSLDVAAKATAAKVTPVPFNIAVIMDTTISMDSIDTNCNNKSQLECAMAGFKVLLQGMKPKYDSVSLFTFPAVTLATAQQNVNCGAKATGALYTTPAVGAATYSPTKTTYRIVDFKSDYQTSTGSLNTSSDLVKAANGCLRTVTSSSAMNTYLAGAIYAAQSALEYQLSQYKGSAALTPKSAIILLSDGNANATNYVNNYMGNQFADTTLSSTSGSYPSYRGACGQQVQAAQYATSKNTTVITIAYGAPTYKIKVPGSTPSNQDGCPTDQDAFYTHFGGSNVSTFANHSPCDAMMMMASGSSIVGSNITQSDNFFSDYNVSGSSSYCYSASSATSLDAIFKILVARFNTARVIPNDTE
jgi:Flp pilus assembly protein TadG